VLFEQTSLDAWAKVVSQHIELNQSDIVFFTSGTSGKRKAISHSWQNLIAEAQAWLTLIGDKQHIYINVPKHHIYGFIWGALIPSIQNISVTDYRKSLINQAPLIPNALIVTVPHAASLLSLIEPDNIQGASVVMSTAPCEHELLQKLAKRGFKNVYHIYGSTETGGVGVRDQNHENFQLRTDLKHDNERIYFKNRLLPLQDNLSFIDENTFTILGRLDSAIQINGYNVSIAELEQNIKQLTEVKDAGVRLLKDNALDNLDVLIQVHENKNIDAVRQKIMQDHSKIIKPQYLLITETSIRNTMGKLAPKPIT
jgi:4-coumarate--CoA ligase